MPGMDEPRCTDDQCRPDCDDVSHLGRIAHAWDDDDFYARPENQVPAGPAVSRKLPPEALAKLVARRREQREDLHTTVHSLEEALGLLQLVERDFRVLQAAYSIVERTPDSFELTAQRELERLAKEMALQRVTELEAELEESRSEIARHHRDFERWESMADQGYRYVGEVMSLRDEKTKRETSPLFARGEFLLASDSVSDWKVECDALTDADVHTLAILMSRIVGSYGSVEGVPTGGWRFAKELESFIVPGRADGPLLIVDDVFTTGGSMERHRAGRDAIGVVAFARGPLPEWIQAVWHVGACAT